jgi:hypothetical protein
VNFRPFAMERWQSIYENQVAYNLSESGVHPLTIAELLELISLKNPCHSNSRRFDHSSHFVSGNAVSSQ